MKLQRVLLLFIILISLLLNGCTAGREINTLGIVISVGIDKSASGYMVTYQVLNPRAIAATKPTNEAPIFSYTETGKDLFEIKRKMTEESPRKMYHSHLRTVVLSEEVAKEGIKGILDFFTRGHEYRTDFYFLIARDTTAKNILNTISPLESVSGLELFHSLETSERAWAPTKTIKVYELVNALNSKGNNPVLTGVASHEADGSSNSLDALKQSDPPKIKLAGLGAFKKDKLAGWLTEDESKGYSYITGNVKSTAGYILYHQNRITFEVTKSDSKVKAYILNGKPAINVKLNLETDISASTGSIDLTNEATIDKLRILIAERIKNLCYGALNRTKNDLGTDIFGFGEEIHKKYPKLWKNLSEDWNNEFVKLPVNINVKADINGLGENTRSVVLSEGNN